MENNINFRAYSDTNLHPKKNVEDLSESNLLANTYPNTSNNVTNTDKSHNFNQEGIPINQTPIIHPQYQPNNISSSVIHIVRTLPPIEREYSDTFSKVACNSVTTTWLGNYGYSYLSTYTNDSNYFFLSRGKDGFTSKEWSEDKTMYKISKEIMIQFINDFNSISNIAKILNNFNAKIERPKRKNTVLFIIFAIIFLMSLICWVSFRNNKRHKIFFQILLPIVWAISWLLSVIFLVLWIAGCTKSKNSTAAERDKIIINQTPQIENFISQWNNNIFLPNGLYIIVPRNLSYIQFSLNSSTKFSLEDHQFPIDLKPKRVYSLSKLYV